MIEAEIVKYFDKTVEVWRWSEVDDAWGGKIKVWAKFSEVDGALRPLAGQFRLSADKETVFATHKFYCFPTDIIVGDQIRYDGEEYEVTFAQDVMRFSRLMQIEMRLVE